MNTHATDPPTDPSLPTEQEARVMLRAAAGQIRFTRQYTRELLQATPRELWYTIPKGSASHVAWQVGHLAVSQYGLLLFRIRGRQPEDLDLIPGRFRKTFGRGGTPPRSAEGQPTAEELLAKLDGVDDAARTELENVTPATLLQPIDMPYAVYPCKLGAILFCPIHEQLHGGQIGLLRRGLGLAPIR